ncbi:MAG: hypothetical protein IJG05_04035, partial [Solobacterium sp.]|nr:hypothetical protein [Solobacterium sp.]
MSERRMLKTYLDEIPWGTDEDLINEQNKTRKERKELPEGCHETVLYRDIMRIAWPSLVEQLLTSLVSMADMIMVGSMVNGDDAISAVCLAYQPKFIVISLMIALNIGVTAAVARDRGAGLHEKANDTLRQGLVMSLGGCIFASIAGFLASRPLVAFMANGGLSADIERMSVQYLQIQMIGFTTMGIGAT